MRCRSTAASRGASPTSIATPHHYYLHGISPDGTTLVYVGVKGPARQRSAINIFTIPAAGGPDTRLTDVRLAATTAPEYSPDGQWIWFNSERASPGHAQCFQMRADGTEHRAADLRRARQLVPAFLARRPVDRLSQLSRRARRATRPTRT